MTPQPLYVRITEAQAYFSMSRDTAERRAKEGAFRIYRRGNLSFLKVSEVSAWIEGVTE